MKNYSSDSDTDNIGMEENKNKNNSDDNKRVTFHWRVQCRTIISREEYTEEEAHNCWLSDREMEKMTERRSKTVQRMESGKSSRRESTYRGLERLSQKGGAESEDVIHHCVHQVLDEQDRQYFLEVQDFEMIALVSSQSSEECILKAIQRGQSDAREAKRCYRRLKDLEDCITDASSSSSAHNHSDFSTSSISVSDYERPNLVPILKTGNGQQGDIRESPPMQTLEVIC